MSTTDWVFPATVMSAARGIIGGGRLLEDASTPGAWWVQAHGQRAFRVRIDTAPSPDWARCNCRDGAPLGGTSRCKHVVAVLMRLKERRDGQDER